MQICTHQNCIFSSLFGLKNGFDYGFKIRFCHSLLYSIAFQREQSFYLNIQQAFQKAIEHGVTLGLFCAFTKLIVCLQTKIRNKQSSYHNLLAGIIGGALFFSKNTHVRSQVMLYIFSRVLKSFPLHHQKKFPQIKYWKILAALTWQTINFRGIVLYLFEINYKNMTFSMAKDLKFIFKDSNQQDQQQVRLMPLEKPRIIQQILIL